ncbi:probable N-acetylglucosaminyl-phosphatidylinositol de-N-acetylase isoform X3 [Amborella trichopoda]|uniref:probable N-acetylglucosaminyl-phosphatidylinositol de-N-acetylase isoform X3 n=1 Tax=Amborella trichopoda TaxID=13333 RepID=UPI0009BEAC7A|nr:probable N-acetylglucosaminyl-phosphatidylinositol de-N-acetylase isoform X3 [Amborella trichopoda]|eukprot:XP_020517248.1 probable N-acetylglucosaminyl-phosphatidylinositol de-N-acetylase isoform X3 [Amborella trichopoda]
MVWLGICMLIILWVVSFFVVLYGLSGRNGTLFLSSGAGDITKKMNILLVIAHPDDESMFFIPTIIKLTSAGHNLHILCISTGDADGKGSVRSEELYCACTVLKVPIQNVKIINHASLQDGFNRTWRHTLLATIIGEEAKSWDVDVVSTNIVRKYCGPVDIWCSMLHSLLHQKGQVHCFVNAHPTVSFNAMAQHKSQWVWFRKLFVLLSSYSYVNSLRELRRTP